MSGVVDSKVRQVVNRLVLSSGLPIHCEIRQLLALEFIVAREADGVGGVQISFPVADPVGITRPQEDADILVYQLLKGRVIVSGICAMLTFRTTRHRLRPTITSPLEFYLHRRRAFGERLPGPYCGLNEGLP
jgi:hypothetical protein